MSEEGGFKKKGGGTGGGEGVVNRLKIFVGNLPFTADNKSVQSHFESCGRIVGVNVRKKK